LRAQKGQTMPEEISARDFGRLEAEVNSLRELVKAQTVAMNAMTGRLDAMNATLSEARGGWKTLMWIGGSAGALGSGLTWLLTHFKGGPT
jgi:hypothetical protein